MYAIATPIFNFITFDFGTLIVKSMFSYKDQL